GRGDHEGVAERMGEEGGADRGLEVEVAVAQGAVDHDQGALDPRVAGLERIGPVDHRPGLAAEGYPLGAFRGFGAGLGWGFGLRGGERRRSDQDGEEGDQRADGGSKILPPSFATESDRQEMALLSPASGERVG